MKEHISFPNLRKLSFDNSLPRMKDFRDALILNYLIYVVLILLLARTDSTVPFTNVPRFADGEEKGKEITRVFSISENERGYRRRPVLRIH